MSQMNADEKAVEHLKIMICGHLRHLWIDSLRVAGFSISFARVNNRQPTGLRRRRC
jgi:hypothetical protein